MNDTDQPGTMMRNQWGYVLIFIVGVVMGVIAMLKVAPVSLRVQGAIGSSSFIGLTVHKPLLWIAFVVCLLAACLFFRSRGPHMGH
jgi:ABC-type antimicrobial peptide transport system permease subunit